jgi:hypothetical protein
MDDGFIPEPPVQASAAPPPAPVAPKRYVFNRHTVERTMEAYELVMIIDMILGGFALDLTAEEFAALSPNVKRHFRAVNSAPL